VTIVKKTAASIEVAVFCFVQGYPQQLHRLFRCVAYWLVTELPAGFTFNDLSDKSKTTP
jgi:hypothetical protein